MLQSHVCINDDYQCSNLQYIYLPPFPLQLQVQLQSNMPQPDLDGTGTNGAEDEIDAALNDLQVSLEGSTISTTNDITKIPELQDYLRFFK